jgi:hypothetical protein
LLTGEPSHQQKQALAYGERLEDLPSQWTQKQAGVIILIWDKVDIKPTLVNKIKKDISY